MTPDPAVSPLLNQRRRPAKARLLLAAASGLAVLLAAGCSGGGGGTSAVSGTITIAAVPGVDDAPLWLASEQGLFAAAGLNVVIKTFGDGSDAAQVAAVESGQAQIAASDYGNILAEQAAPSTKSTLRLLADAYDAGTGTVEILVGPDSKVTTPSGLLNVAIGVPSQVTISTTGSSAKSTVPPGLPESLDAVAATQAIESYLLSSALDLTWQPMSQGQELSELQSGQLKAALLTEPYLYEAEKDFGAVELMDVFSGQSANLPLSGYVSQTSWAKSNPTAVADFQSAISKAQADASMVGPVQQTLQKEPAGISAAVADMVSLGTYPTATSRNALSRVASLMDTADVVKVDSQGLLISLLG